MRIVVSGEPARLDRFVAEQLGGRSRRETRALIAAGGVRANGRVAHKGDLVRPGDVIEIDLPAPASLQPQPELGLSILFEDALLIAVDKPAGMPSVALRAEDRNTLANALLGRYPELAKAGGDPHEAGLVHRLDTGTSGVILAARTAEAWRALRTQFRAGGVEKRYHALVAGVVRQSGSVRTPIAHHPRRPRLMAACDDQQRAAAWRARPALTRYRPLHLGEDATLLEVVIRSGVRHQIRVHLAAVGMPIAGDPLYGPSPVAAPRLMLHAAQLVVRHPATGSAVTIACPQPEDYRAVLRRHGVA